MAAAHIFATVYIIVLNMGPSADRSIPSFPRCFYKNRGYRWFFWSLGERGSSKRVARGVFSNESGLGSAPIAAAAAKTEEPVEQGLISMDWDLHRYHYYL